MKVSKFAKWTVENGAEGMTIELTPEDIGLRPAGEINTALDQIRMLQYLSTYILFQRMMADGVMTQKQFDDEMLKFGFERGLVTAYLKSMEADKKPKNPTT